MVKCGKYFDEKKNLNFKVLRRIDVINFENYLQTQNVTSEVHNKLVGEWFLANNTSISMFHQFYSRQQISLEVTRSLNFYSENKNVDNSNIREQYSNEFGSNLIFNVAFRDQQPLVKQNDDIHQVRMQMSMDMFTSKKPYEVTPQIKSMIEHIYQVRDKNILKLFEVHSLNFAINIEESFILLKNRDFLCLVDMFGYLAKHKISNIDKLLLESVFIKEEKQSLGSYGAVTKQINDFLQIINQKSKKIYKIEKSFLNDINENKSGWLELNKKVVNLKSIVGLLKKYRCLIIVRETKYITDMIDDKTTPFELIKSIKITDKKIGNENLKKKEMKIEEMEKEKEMLIKKIKEMENQIEEKKKDLEIEKEKTIESTKKLLDFDEKQFEIKSENLPKPFQSEKRSN